VITTECTEHTEKKMAFGQDFSLCALCSLW